MPDQLLTAYLDSLAPGTTSIILDGLELVGEWASGGPPGTKRPDPRLQEFVFLLALLWLQTKKDIVI